MKKEIKNKGFTLIETIVYSAIFVVVSLLVVGGLTMMMKVFSDVRVSRNINRSAETALERMTREIRQAVSINLSESDLISDLGYLKLNTVPEGGATSTIRFFVSGDSLIVQEGDSDVGDLITSNSRISKMSFKQINASTIAKAIKIEMELKVGSGSFEKTEKFYSTAVLRGSY